MYEATTGVTWHTVLKQAFFISRKKHSKITKSIVNT